MSNDSVNSTVKATEIDLLLRPRTKNLFGVRFGFLSVINFSGYKGRGSCAYWICLCVCGKEKDINSRHLLGGNIKSCGCKKEELNSNAHKRHGKSHSPIHQLWWSMLARCLNPNNPSFKDYGGRGITIDERWLKFENFYEEIGKSRPSAKHSLDRINVNKGYSVENCRWATAKEQMQNRRDSVRLTVFGQTATISQWADLTGTKKNTIATRYYNKWTHYECVYGRNTQQNN